MLFYPILRKRSTEERSALDRRVTAEEMNDALQSFNADKAQGPDGFNGKFFDHFRHLLGPDVTRA